MRPLIDTVNSAELNNTKIDFTGFITMQLRVHQLKYCENKLLISSCRSTSLSTEKIIAVLSA